MNLSYLSWAWAWGILMEHYPDAKIGFYEQKETGIPYVQMPDGSAEVRCRVQIGNLIREMWLPVMDYKNNAVEDPNSRQVSDTKMRCLVKCLALFGLGHYIYGGEDTPSDDTKRSQLANLPLLKKKILLTSLISLRNKMLTLKLGRISKVGIGQKRSLMDSKLPVTCMTLNQRLDKLWLVVMMSVKMGSYKGGMVLSLVKLKLIILNSTKSVWQN